MDPVATAVVVGISVTALALVLYGLVSAWRKMMRDRGPLPLYGMLKQKGLTPVDAGDRAGLEALAHAARRCAHCSSSAQCEQRVAAGAPPPADCPNAALFTGLARPRA